MNANPPPPTLHEAAADLLGALLQLARAHATSAPQADPALLLAAAAFAGALAALIVVRPLLALLAPGPSPSYAQLVPAHRAQSTFAGLALAFARRHLPFARKAVEKAREDLRKEMQTTLRPSGAPPPLTSLPERPTPPSQVLAMVKSRESKGPRLPTNGHAPFSGALYVRSAEHVRLLNEVAAAASLFSNPLHGPGLFPAVRQMEAEVVAMTAGLVGGGGSNGNNPEVCGLMTSGGTESIVTALKAARDYCVEKKGAVAFSSGPPEIVASPHAHAAVIKAAEWLGMRIRWAQPDEQGRLRAPAVKKAMSRRTVCVYASAPSYPWGVVDDVRALAAVARRWGACVHVDACLGGFVLPFLDDREDEQEEAQEGGGSGQSNPTRRRRLALAPASPYARPGAWDFSVSGVTSMSLDTHKYGLAPKGSSVLLFASPAHRRHCYTAVTDWPGGLYISPSLPGSRSGALIATAWASLVALGREGLRSSARRAAAAAREFARRLPEEVPGLEVLPGGGAFVPDTTVVAFRAAAAAGRRGGGAAAGAAAALDVYRLNDRMEARGGWRLSALQRPPALHFCFTDASAECVGELLRDIKLCAAAERAGGPNASDAAADGGAARLYGASAAVPDRSIVGEALEVVQDCLLSV
jgi:sphinganine-1-phosphate aldolase